MEALLSRGTSALQFVAISVVLFMVACSLVYFKAVKVKMLPFDNKNEFQVLVDYPPITPLKSSVAFSEDLARDLLGDPDVEKVQIFAGEAAPFSFSGMVKHTFLRESDFQNDLQVVLKTKDDRKRSSHEIIGSLRERIAKFGNAHEAVTKVLEIPPGPPVLATMMAEIYGSDQKARELVAKDVYRIFSDEKSVVDLDCTWRLGRPRRIYSFDPSRGAVLGTDATTVANTGRLIFSESPVVSLDTVAPEEVNVDLSIEQQARSGEHPLLGETLPSFQSGVVAMDQAVKPSSEQPTESLYRKNLKPVSYVMSELSGAEEAPVYGILKLAPKIHVRTQTAEVPWNTQEPVVKWDGEWFITYEVFRDLGGAFAVVMVLIYILVLGWFRSFAVPLIIMAPIPISLIGILPGHAVLGAYFTATSMIGFIAGAGIIVRNSIILVDFIEQQLKSGMTLKDAVVSAGVLRFRPMLLTAAAVVVGSSVMLSDPIFQGLAVSLMFGEIAATVLSRFLVPVFYYWLIGASRVRFFEGEEKYGH